LYLIFRQKKIKVAIQKRPPRLFAPPLRFAPVENVRRLPLPLPLLVFVEYLPEGGVYIPRSGNFFLEPSMSRPEFDKVLLAPSCFLDFIFERKKRQIDRNLNSLFQM